MRGFNVIHYLPDHAPLDVDSLSEPIHILPLQAQDLGNAEPEADGNQHEQAKSQIVVELVDEELKFTNVQTARLANTLGHAFDRDQRHRIAFRRNLVAPHGIVPENLQQAADVSLAFGSDSQTAQPQLDRSRLNVGNGMVGPLGQNVVG